MAVLYLIGGIAFMAKCEKCGKKISKDGVCSCTSAGENKSEALNVTSKKKFGDSLIEWGGLAFFIIILGVITLLAIGSPSRTAKKFAKAVSRENGGKTYCSLAYPDEFIDNIKSDEYIARHPSIKSWDNEVSDYKAAKEAEFKDGKLEVKSVEKKGRLSTDAVNCASSYFKTKFSVQNYHCTRGYEYKVTFDKEGSDKALSYNICVVKLKNDGWKVIEMSSERLIDEY